MRQRLFFLIGTTLLSLFLFSFNKTFYPTRNPAPPTAYSKDSIIFVEADPSQGFNYPYYIRIPKGINTAKPQYLLVETNNTGNNDTLLYHQKETLLQLKRNSLGSNLCEYLKVPFLMPVFPRPLTEWQLYTHALDRETMQVKNGPMRRLDEQLLAMIRHARSRLSLMAIQTKPKILINGFSASGTFANRFTILHPEAVAGAAYGGINGIVTLPVKSLEGQKLNYPLGISDLKKLTGITFNDSVYKQVPQYIYMGGKDTNDAVDFDDAYIKKERELVHKVLAKKMVPDRFEKCKSVFQSFGASATFTIYPNIGHETDREVFFGVVGGFQKIIQHTSP